MSNWQPVPFVMAAALYNCCFCCVSIADSAEWTPGCPLCTYSNQLFDKKKKREKLRAEYKSAFKSNQQTTSPLLL